MKTRTAIYIGFVLILAGAGTYYWKSAHSQGENQVNITDDEALPEEDQTPPPASVPKDWKIKRFWDIHRVKPGTFDQDADFVIHDGEKISEWFRLEFENAGQEYLLFVTKIQSLNADGELQDGHGQAIMAGAGLYKRTNKDWELVLANENIGEYGSNGDAPEVKTPVILEIGPQRKAVLIEGVFCNQGECLSTDSILEVSMDRLEEIGTINIGGDNSGQCNDESDLKCYSYTSKVESIPDGSKSYYDLVIKKTGRELNDEGSIVPSHDTVVSYQESKYEELK